MDNLDEYYEALLDVFASKGWKYLVEDWTLAADDIDSLVGVDTMEKLHHRRGKLEVLASLIHMPEQIRQMMDEREEEADDDFV